jgi:exosortase D (VPLPA-CTERM-specific)
MGNSVQAAPLVSARPHRLFSGLPLLHSGVLLVLIGWLYFSILYRLIGQWVVDPNFSYAFIVPLFSAFVIWQDRQQLAAVLLSPSWAGLSLIVLALAMLVFGQLGVELFVSRLSLLVLLAGLIVLFAGWSWFRAVLFPWAFLILMIPPPNIILQMFTFPLQLLASRLATLMLQTVRVPVLRQGNVIELARMRLEVVEACSGIRSLLALITLAIIYGFLMEKRVWVRVVLACSAIPIAVLANGFRIFGTGLLVQYWDPDKAEGFFHLFQGWIVFVVSLLMLFAFHRLINVIWKPKAVLPAGPSRATQPARPMSSPNQFPRFLVAVFLMLVAAAGLEAHSQGEIFPPRQPLSALPAEIDGWTSTDETLDQPTLDILGPGEFLLRDYQDPANRQPWVNLFVAYFPSQKMGDTIHSPNHCLPGAGWTPISKQVVYLKGADGTSFPANRYVITQAGDRQLVLFWFQAHGRAVASQYQAKYYLIADSIHMRRSDGALVRLMTPMLPGESPNAAQARIMQLGDPIIPLLDNYIPR